MPEPGRPPDLVELASQPTSVAWPTHGWPVGDPAERVRACVDEVVDATDRYGTTYAVVVVQGGRLVAERYAGVIGHSGREPERVGPDTTLRSWSMAKSVVQAWIGLLVGDGRLSLDQRAPVAAWSAPGDPRAAVTIGHLLAMRDGLAFVEDYTEGHPSDVIEMLWGAGAADVAAFAADRPLAHAPGARFNYSSGTTNILARIAGDLVGDGPEGATAYLRERLFDPIGMTSVQLRFDPAGTFVGSSSLFATARDYARFGLLYLRDGRWDGRRLLPAGWVDRARRPQGVDPDNGWSYGEQWWVVGDELGGFWANGYAGQSILCVPALDLVVVRLGRSDPSHADALRSWRDDITRAAIADAD